MKFSVTILFLFLAVTLFAANPAYTDFRGTNEVLVTTNPATGRIIIGPATPISAQINAAQVWTDFQDALADIIVPRVGFSNVVIGYTGIPASTTVNLEVFNNPNSTASPSQRGGVFANGTSKLIFGYPAMICIEADQFARNPANNNLAFGESASVVGDTGGCMSQQYGLVGISTSVVSGQTNVGVVGIGTRFGTSGVFAGGMFMVAEDETLIPIVDNAGLIADSMATGLPIFMCRTNGGTFKAFQVNGDKTTNATPLDVAGLTSAYNGIATLLRNTSTNSLITVGSSPFNFTNTASQTIVLYLDANGATTTANLNGQTIFKSLAAGDHTIILKPGAYTTITFAIATPIMTWTEL
jgi:hypothetical protein